jgi:hypothetical protein
MSITENTKILLVYTTYKYNPEVYRLVITSEVNNQAASLQVLDLKVFCNEPSIPITGQGSCLLAQGGP